VPVDRGALRPGDLAVWDGHVAMIVGNGMIEARNQMGVQNARRHGIASAQALCPSKPSDVAIAR
jgi:cell wall-associated NlpC family hydrolase